MARNLVIGSSCAGKSTLAQRISKALDIHYIQLDAIQWLPNWIERDEESFLELLEKEVASHQDWVVDGNYSRTHYITWAKADVVIWLNYSYPVVLKRAFSRTFRRAWTKEKIFSDNIETFRRSFFSRDSILFWVITGFFYRRRRYEDIRQKNQYAHLTWIELKKPAEAEHITRRLKDLGIIQQIPQ